MKVIVPLFVMLPRKTIPDKKIIINLNYYRNWCFQVANQVKVAYCEQLESALGGVRLRTPISISFKLFKASNRKTDRSNVLSIHEKFFCDALVHYGCIKDDNDDYIFNTAYSSGGCDKNNPRVEIDVL